MFDLDAVSLNDDDLIEILYSSRADLYIAVRDGFAKHSVVRQVGDREIIDQCNFFDGLEFALVLYLRKFFSDARASDLADEWSDMIANSL